MHNRHSCLTLACLTVLAAVTPVRSLAAQVDNNNAAAWYQKAIDAYDALNLDWETDLRPVLEEFVNNPQIGPSPEAQRTLARLQPVLDLAARGTAQEYSDFNLDYQQGFELLLPHLGSMRNLTKLMNADAMARVHAGDMSGAAERVSNMYDMSGHLTGDRTLISSLVGNAIFNMGERTIEYGLDREAFNAADAASMLGALEHIDDRDPFGMLEAVALEAELATNWFNNKFREGQELGELGEQMIIMMTGNESNEEAIEYWSGLEKAEFDDQVGQYETLMDEMVSVFNIDDPETAAAEFDRLEREIADGLHGELSKIMTPALSKIHERMLESREVVAARKAMLRELAEGVASPTEYANAVTYYLRAIDLLESHDAAALAAMRRAADARGAPIDERVIRTIADLQPTVDLVREGSLKRKCDFVEFRPRHPAMLAAPYAAGLHDLMRLLSLDASLALTGNDRERLVDRLAIVYRFAGHIGMDDQLMSSAIGHDGMARTLPILQRAAESSLISADDRNHLYAALQHVKRTDPFGYIRAVTETRNRVSAVARMSWFVMQENGTYAHKPGYDPAPVADWTAVRLAMLTAVIEHAWITDAMPPPSTPSFNERELRYVTDPDDLVRLHDLLDELALAEARRSTPLHLSMMTQGQLDQVTAQPVHDVLQLGALIPKARNDLRQATGLLRPMSDAE